MKYGYFDAFITNIGEDVQDKVSKLEAVAEEIVIDYLSYRPALDELIEKLNAGDVIYITSFNRFASGLRDLDALLTEIIDEKKANVIVLEEDIDFSTDFGKGVKRGFTAALPMINADPITGFFK